MTSIQVKFIKKLSYGNLILFKNFNAGTYSKYLHFMIKKKQEANFS